MPLKHAERYPQEQRYVNRVKERLFSEPPLFVLKPACEYGRRGALICFLMYERKYPH